MCLIPMARDARGGGGHDDRATRDPGGRTSRKGDYATEAEERVHDPPVRLLGGERVHRRDLAGNRRGFLLAHLSHTGVGYRAGLPCLGRLLAHADLEEQIRREMERLP